MLYVYLLYNCGVWYVYVYIFVFIYMDDKMYHPEQWITWFADRWRTQLIARQLVNCRTHEHWYFERTLRSWDTISRPHLTEGRVLYKPDWLHIIVIYYIFGIYIYFLWIIFLIYNKQSILEFSVSTLFSVSEIVLLNMFTSVTGKVCNIILIILLYWTVHE